MSDLRAKERAFGQRLVDLQVLDAVQLRSALAWVKQWDGRLTRAFFELRLTTEAKIVEVVAQIANVTVVDLEKTQVDPAAVALLDAAYCRQKGILPFAVKPDAKLVAMAMAEPFDTDTLAEVSQRLNLNVVAVAAGEGQIQDMVSRSVESLGKHQYGVPTPIAQEFADGEFTLVDGRGAVLDIEKPTFTLAGMGSIDLDLERAPERMKSATFDEEPAAAPPMSSPSGVLQVPRSSGSLSGVAPRSSASMNGVAPRASAPPPAVPPASAPRSSASLPGIAPPPSVPRSSASMAGPVPPPMPSAPPPPSVPRSSASMTGAAPPPSAPRSSASMVGLAPPASGGSGLFQVAGSTPSGFIAPMMSSDSSPAIMGMALTPVPMSLPVVSATAPLPPGSAPPPRASAPQPAPSRPPASTAPPPPPPPPGEALMVFKVGAWTNDDEVNDFVRANLAVPALELRKLLEFALSKHSSQADPVVHKRRAAAIAGLVTGKKDPQLLVLLVKAFKEGDPTLKAALAKPLAVLDDIPSLSALAPQLGHADAATRKLAVAIFSTPRSLAHLEGVQNVLKERSFAGRAEALEVLVRGGGFSAIALLTTELPAAKPPERLLALRALGDMRVLARDVPAVLALLASFFADTNDEVARTALQSYCELCSEEDWFRAVAPVVEQPSLARAAIEGLRRFSSPRVVVTLEHRLRAGPNALRLAVLSVVEAQGSNALLGVLVEALGHKQLAVRTKAGEIMSALSRAEKLDLSRTIIWLLRSPDVNVRRMAAGLVSSIRAPAEDLWPKLLAVLRDEDWWVRERLADALVQMAGPALAPHLVPYLSADSEVVRRWAVELLGRLKAPETLGALVRAAQNDGDWWVRERAILTIGELGDPRSVPYLLDLLQRVPDDQAACLDALRMMHAPEALEPAVTLLASPSAQVRLAALEVVGFLGDNSLATAVQPLLHDGDVDVRTRARGIAEGFNISLAVTEEAVAQLTLLDQLLTRCTELHGDDVFLAPGRVVYFKRLGKVEALTNNAMSEEQVRNLLAPLLTPERAATLEKGEDVDFSYELKAKSLRYRVNLFTEAKGPAAVFRIIKGVLPSADAIGLPPQVLGLAQLSQGLVLIGGPTGSGKSTTLAVLIDSINRTDASHIICLEDPIEFLHADKKSIVTQRELGSHTQSMSNALRATLREDPDVILMGELRDLPSISFAVTAAETGHLVFGTVHTVSADSSIDRLINAFPQAQQQQVRSMLAESLRAVVCQYLLPATDGGRVLALEVLLNTDASAALIRKGKTHQLHSVMVTSQAEGMRLMDTELMKLVKAGRVTAEDAFVKARSKKDFEALLADVGKSQRKGG
ncbi:MAG: PilT/PilU family type 4a pilus ATPase [Archangium sp.]|nr:PilT/PilU family type 4a pilus ATPase [Archangium sp.]